MQTHSRLAIVIPAYKGGYLGKTLDSITKQTCKDFNLYIGDDNSPEDLNKIVERYKDRLNIVYKRFNDNLGGGNLVDQWSRCINLTKNEEWIWLFSDDDMMDECCVEEFYNFININKTADLLHFDIDIIDKYGNKLKEGRLFPDLLKVEDFFYRRIKNRIYSTVTEYIFKKSVYQNHNGFQNYDLAWCSDDATWIKFGNPGGIASIRGAKVNFRDSGTNISSIYKDKTVVQRKLKSNINHIMWIKAYFIEKNLHDKTSDFEKLKWVISGLLLTEIFSFKEKCNFTFDTIKQLGYDQIKLLCFLFVIYIHLKKKDNRSNL